MGIICALLTGGVSIGKVCQALNGVAVRKRLANEARVIDPNLTIAGIRFMKSNDNREQKMQTYAYNITSNDISFGCPNLAEGGGIQHTIKPMHKILIDEFLNESIRPDTRFNIGPIAQVGTNNRMGSPRNLEPALKIVAKDVPITTEDISVAVDSIEISASPQGLTITTNLAVTAIIGLSMISDCGIDAETFEGIWFEPSPGGGKKDNKYFFPINMADCGFKLGDKLECRIGLALSADNAVLRARSRSNIPITEEEWEYLRFIRAIRLD